MVISPDLTDLLYAVAGAVLGWLSSIFGRRKK
jgi:hypothetical protein